MMLPSFFFIEDNKNDINLKKIPKFKCFKVPQVSYCKIFDKENPLICAECQDKYYLVHGICLKGDIKNCLKYQVLESSKENNTNQTETINDIQFSVTIYKLQKNAWSKTCVQCQKGYFITSSGHCRVYNFDPFCKNQIYSPKTGNCEICIDTHYFKSSTSIRGSFKKCVPYNLSLNCKSYDLTDGKCLSCDDEKFYLDIEEKECVALDNLIPGCKDFLLGREKCKTCKKNWYLNAFGKCSQIIPIKYCEEYVLNSSDCFRCEIGYFPERNQQNRIICYENPIAIPFCAEYGIDGICVRCIDTYIFSKETNRCEEALGIIENCTESVDNIICLKCKKGYLLKNNLCKPVKNLNCLDNIDEINCRSCPKDHLLVNENGFWDCHIFSIPFCKEVRIEYDFISFDMISYNQNIPEKVSHIDALLTKFKNKKKYKVQMAKCFECKRDYIYDHQNQKCRSIKKEDKVEGCISFGIPGQCRSCADEYYLDQSTDKCIKKTLLNRDYKELIKSVKYSEKIQKKIKQRKFYTMEKINKKDFLKVFRFCSKPTKPKQPICIKCRGGYYLDSLGKCSKCLVENCNQCDYLNPRSCLICNSGHFMVSNFLKQIFCINNRYTNYEDFKTNNASMDQIRNNIQKVLIRFLMWSLILKVE